MRSDFCPTENATTLASIFNMEKHSSFFSPGINYDLVLQLTFLQNLNLVTYCGITARKQTHSAVVG